MIWNNAKMSVVYNNKDVADEGWPCVVKLSEEEIIVEYDDEGMVQYKGKNSGNGHFELHAEDVNGRATLHMFPDSTLLEGSWVEDGERGMWKISLE